MREHNQKSVLCKVILNNPFDIETSRDRRLNFNASSILCFVCISCKTISKEPKRGVFSCALENNA